MMPTEMELRVAKVLDPAAFGERDPSRLDAYYEAFQRTALLKASAAIRAMREPTKAMVYSGMDYGGSDDAECAVWDAWRAMIDAATSVEPEPR